MRNHLLALGAEPSQAKETTEGARGSTAAARGATPYEELANGNWVGTADQISERIRTVVDAAVDYLIVYLSRVDYDQTPVRRFAAGVIPWFA